MVSRPEDFLDIGDELDDLFPKFMCTNDFDVSQVLPDLGGDLQMDVTAHDDNKFSLVETLGSGFLHQSSTLESLLKSVPTSSCVPPAPQLHMTMTNPVSVCAGTGGQDGMKIKTSPPNHVELCDQKKPYLVQQEQHVMVDQPGRQQTLMSQLLKSENEDCHGQLIAPNSTQQNGGSNDAARKLQIIKQLLESNDGVASVQGQAYNGHQAELSAQQIRQLLQGVPIQGHPQQVQSAVQSAPTLAASLTGQSSGLLTVISQPMRVSNTVSSSNLPSSLVEAVNSSAQQHYSKGGGDDSASEMMGSTCGGRGRRSSHNAIEKRYRLSINDKIDELRDMLAEYDAKDAKLSKSAVLKKAIERMRHLLRENERLRDEVIMLRGGKRSMDLVVDSSCRLDHNLSGYASPSNSDASSDSVSIMGQEQMSPHKQQASESTSPASSPRSMTSSTSASTGGGNKLARLLLSDVSPTENFVTGASRITLCMFACVLLVFSPMDYLLSGPGGGQQVAWSGHEGDAASRQILSVNAGAATGAGEGTPLPQWAIWAGYLVQWLVALGLLYSAAPSGMWRWRRVASGACVGQETLANRHWTQAEREFEKGSWLNAQSQLKACLICLGCPIPARSIDWTICALSNGLRLPFTILSHATAASLTCDEVVASTKDSSQAVKARMRVLQLVVSDMVPMTKFQTMTLLVSLYNQVIALRSGMTSEELAEIFVCLGLAARKCLPFDSFSVFVSRWYYASALWLAQSSDQMPRSWDWLRTGEGYAYLCDYKVNTADPLEETFCVFGQKWRLLDQLRAEFRAKLLEDAMEAIASDNGDKVHRALYLLSLLESLSTEADVEEVQEELDEEKDIAAQIQAMEAELGVTSTPGTPKKKKQCGIRVNRGADNTSLWWSRMGRVAALWRQGKASDVDELHRHVTDVPRRLRLADWRRGRSCQEGATKDRARLANGVLLAYRTNRRALLGSSEGNKNSEGLCQYKALQTAKQATNLLAHDLDRDGNRKALLWRAIACDWLLTAQASLGSSCEEDLKNFSTTLTILRDVVNKSNLNPRKWILIHEATLRIISGGNPLRTSLLIRQCALDPTERKSQLVKELVRFRGPGTNGVRSVN